MDLLKLTRYHRATEPFLDLHDGVTKRAVFVTRTATLLEIDEHTWQLLASGKFEELGDTHLEFLFSKELLVFASENELETILSENDHAASTPTTLRQVIQPTANCQLACWYCPQKHFTKQMNEENQSLLVDRVRDKLSAHRYQELEVGWFGAEPLMGLRTIRRLSPMLQSVAASAKVRYRAKMVTNGLALTSDVATELVNDHKVQWFEVTIDGSEEAHDAVRHTKGGKGTYHAILNNVISFARRDDLAAEISVRCNVDFKNRDTVGSLMRVLADAGIQNRIQRFYLSPVYNWGDNNAGDMNASRKEFAEWEVDWMAEMIGLGFNVSLLPKRNRVTCLAVRPDADLVDPNGVLFNCTEVSLIPGFERPNHSLHSVIDPSEAARTNIHAIGSLKEGEDSTKRQTLQSFNNLVRDGRFDCPSCPMLPVCGGACPKQWLEGTLPCPTAKFNIEQRILLARATRKLAESNSQK